MIIKIKYYAYSAYLFFKKKIKKKRQEGEEFIY